MSEEGQRIEFGDKGPYLLQELAMEPQAMLLEEHDVCLLQFDQLFIPVSLAACAPFAAALANMSQADIGPERAGMIPLDIDTTQMTELPLVTRTDDESFQHNETIYVDVFFGDTQARLCFSIYVAAVIGQVLSQVPAE